MRKPEPEQTASDEQGLIMVEGRGFLGAKGNLKPSSSLDQ